jgi:hypothetical protein
MLSQVWWYMPVILALEKLRQENHDFKAKLGYMAKHCPQAKTKQNSDPP